jgi:hypothetical protein
MRLSGTRRTKISQPIDMNLGTFDYFGEITNCAKNRIGWLGAAQQTSGEMCYDVTFPHGLRRCLRPEAVF